MLTTYTLSSSLLPALLPGSSCNIDQCNDIAHRQHLRSAVSCLYSDTGVRSSGLFCVWPSGLEPRLSSRSDTFFWQFSSWSENVSLLLVQA